MEVKLANTAGFCFGVKRAVDTVYEQIETGKKIYTYGPIIHNEEVVKDLEAKGVTVIETLDELKNCEAGTVIIRSHGVSKAEYNFIKEHNFEIVDVLQYLFCCSNILLVALYLLTDVFHLMAEEEFVKRGWLKVATSHVEDIAIMFLVVGYCFTHVFQHIACRTYGNTFLVI